MEANMGNDFGKTIFLGCIVGGRPNICKVGTSLLIRPTEDSQ